MRRRHPCALLDRPVRTRGRERRQPDRRSDRSLRAREPAVQQVAASELAASARPAVRAATAASGRRALDRTAPGRSCANLQRFARPRADRRWRRAAGSRPGAREKGRARTDFRPDPEERQAGRQRSGGRPRRIARRGYKRLSWASRPERCADCRHVRSANGGVQRLELTTERLDVEARARISDVSAPRATCVTGDMRISRSHAAAEEEPVAVACGSRTQRPRVARGECE